MSKANYVQDSFLGGQWSKTAQGQVSHREYKRAMRVSRNCLPVTGGASVRRPGLKEAGRTRYGKRARMLDFDFTQASPYVLEFTPLICRVWQGDQIVTDLSALITAISSDTNPKLTLNADPGFVTGNSVVFANIDPRMGSDVPILYNRHWVLTNLGGGQITLADPITGQSPSAASLVQFNQSEGALTITRIVELPTSYTDADLNGLRKVATDDSGVSNIIILSANWAPIEVIATPNGLGFATFSAQQVTFANGPYFDPVAGSIITPDAISGLVNLTLSYATYSGSTVYKTGSFVLASGIAYCSLHDANLNNTPASNIGTWWRLATLGEGVPGSNGAGFQTTDIGRHVGLINSTTTTWAKIISLSTTGLISPSLAGSSAIGSMSAEGGLAGAFQTSQQALAGSAAYIHPGTEAATPVSIVEWAGKDFGASPQSITSVVVKPPTDYPMVVRAATVNVNFGIIVFPFATSASNVVLELRASSSSPASNPRGGTLLASANLGDGWSTSATLNSNDSSTTFRYVWVVFSYTNTCDCYDLCIGQLSMFTGAVSVGASAQVQIFGPALPNTNAMTVWQAGLYNATSKTFPTSGCYSDGRLWLFGAQDNRFDASSSNAVFDYSLTDGSGTVGDANAISGILNSSDVNPIFWGMPDLQGILLGTQGGEWLLQGSGSNGDITPTSIIVRRITKYRCADAEPARTGLTTCFIQKIQRSVHEFLSDVFSGKFFAPELTELSKDVTASGVAEVSFQSELAPILWARNEDGSLIGCTYRRVAMLSQEPPEFRAWHEHDHGGGHTFNSIAMGGLDGGSFDALTVCALDPVTGLYNVQIMQPIFDEADTLLSSRHLDSYIVPATGAWDAAGVTFKGLHNLDGKKISVFAAGLDCGDYTVANGQVTVPWGSDPDKLFTQAYLTSLDTQGPADLNCTIYDAATGDTRLATVPVMAGFTYTTQGQILPPIDPNATGARTGPSFGKVTRHFSYAARLVNTQGVSFGTDLLGKLEAANFKSRDGRGTIPPKKNQLFTGLHWQTVTDEQSTMDNAICWQVTRPYPCTVAALGGFDSAEDR